MANRYTATEKWNDPWFCGLSPAYKLFWIYLCENCNHAGIWNVNWPLVKFHCWEDQFDPKSFGDRIVVLSDEKWFIKKFVLFQQKINDINELNELNKCHLSIINILKKEGVLRGLEAPSKGLARGYSNSNGNSKGIGNSKKDRIVKERKHKNPTLEDVRSYCLERNSPIDPEIFFHTYESQGWIKTNGQPVLNWKSTLITWEKKQHGKLIKTNTHSNDEQSERRKALEALGTEA